MAVIFYQVLYSLALTPWFPWQPLLTGCVFCVSYRLRLKKQLSIWQIVAQADSSTLTEDITVWVVARIKKQVMKEAVEYYVDVMTAQSCDGQLASVSFIHLFSIPDPTNWI
jgi:hypothetical protein